MSPDISERAGGEGIECALLHYGRRLAVGFDREALAALLAR